MQFLVGLETAPLTMLQGEQLESAAEALLDRLDATGWANGVSTRFDHGSRNLGARFLVEAENIARLAYSSELVFGFLTCVVQATIEALGGTEQLIPGFVIWTGSEMHIEPAPDLLAKIEVERAPVAA